MNELEPGRGERVLPGLFRLRLPLPWPGIPHCNAWAIRAGTGLVLIDCGLDRPGSLEQLEHAMAQVDLSVDAVHTLLITHAHTDHWGQAASVVDRAGAEMWMHPNWEHARAESGDRDLAAAHVLEIGRQSGVPERALRAFVERVRDLPSGVARLIEPDHDLLPGVSIDTDLGPLQVYETPGHAPSHVSLFAPDRRLLISGDHLLGRVAPFFEYGWSPDPVAEFLSSLDTIEALGGDLCICGHGRPFRDIDAHIRANRELVSRRLEATRASLTEVPATALELAPAIFGEDLTPLTAVWRLPETLSYLTHLHRAGAIERDPDGGDGGLESAAERWRAL